MVGGSPLILSAGKTEVVEPLKTVFVGGHAPNMGAGVRTTSFGHGGVPLQWAELNSCLSGHGSGG